MRLGKWVVTLLLVVLASWLLTGPGFRALMSHELQNVFGVQLVSCASSKMNLAGSIEVSEVELSAQQTSSEVETEAPPASIRFDRLVLKFSPQEFLSRRIAIQSAVMQGLHLGSRPASNGCLTSGHEELTQRHSIDWFPSSLLGGIGDVIWREFEKNSASEEESHKASEKWSASFEAIEAERQIVEERFAALRDSNLDASNPLRNRDLLQQRIRDTKELSDRLTQLQNRIEQTTTDFKKDRNQVHQARLSDLEMLTSKRFPTGSNHKNISRSILIELGRSALSRMQSHLDAVSGHSLRESLAAPRRPRRGTDYAFPEIASPGPLNVQMARWNGDIQIGGERYQMEGIVQGLHVSQETMGESTRFHARIFGNETEMRFKGAQYLPMLREWEVIEASATKFGFSSWKMGNKQGLQLICQGKPMSIEMHSYLVDGVRNTELVIEQMETDFGFDGIMTPAGSRVSQQMTASMQSLTELHFKAQVAGSPEQDDHWTIESNLEAVLDRGLEEAIKSEIASHESILKERFRQTANSMESHLNQIVFESTSRLQSCIMAMQSQLDTIKTESIAALDGKRMNRLAKEPLSPTRR